MKLYQAEFEAPYDYIPYFSESLEQDITAEEITIDNPSWKLRVIYESKPKKKDVEATFLVLFAAIGLPCPKINISEIPEKNWVEENQKSFPPINTEKFFIYSEFSEPSSAENLTNIKISPGMAFGTGQHETTYLCLEAIRWLFDAGHQFSRILDFGCGSGILAIAAAKTWLDAEVMASDNDEIAVKVTKENAAMNGAKITPMHCEGLKGIRGNFDLLMANILLNPLIEMASDIGKHGENIIILSGFKSDQIDKIIERYTLENFTPLRMFAKNHWVAAILLRIH